MLVFDCDGVMTDGSVTYDENGVEYKTFNVKDGHGIVRMNKSGFITAIITARNNGTVAHRAKNLNFTEVYQGRQYKLPALEEFMEKYNSVDDGNASNRVLDLIRTLIPEKQPNVYYE